MRDVWTVYRGSDVPLWVEEARVVGGFGNAIHIEHTHSRYDKAIRWSVKRSLISTESDVVAFRREVRVANLQETCDSIVPIYQSILVEEGPHRVGYRLMERAHCDAHVVLQRHEFLEPFATHVRRGLDFLHKNNLCHGDVCLHNVFAFPVDFANTPTFKLGNFEHSVRLNTSAKIFVYDSLGRRPLYRPPKALLDSIVSGATHPKTDALGRVRDLWALGVCLHLILTRTYPFWIVNDEPSLNNWKLFWHYSTVKNATYGSFTREHVWLLDKPRHDAYETYVVGVFDAVHSLLMSNYEEAYKSVMRQGSIRIQTTASL